MEITLNNKLKQFNEIALNHQQLVDDALQEISDLIKTHNYEPVWKDWDKSYT